MKSFLIKFADGNSLKTEFNGNIEDARAYYLGNIFNVGGGEKDNLVKCISVQQIFACKFNGRTIGAIGCFYDIEFDVAADNKEDAHIKLYDTHEHITNLVISE
jgi:hypothetical protein